jgi:hypothetical protein
LFAPGQDSDGGSSHLSDMPRMACSELTFGVKRLNATRPAGAEATESADDAPRFLFRNSDPPNRGREARGTNESQRIPTNFS